MIFKQLFGASFERSQRLRQDSLTSYMITDTEGRKFYRNSFIKGVFATLGILFLYGMTAIVKASVEGRLGRTTVEALKINLLPNWLFLICLLIWLFVWQWTIRKRYEAITTYFSVVNANTYIIWLTLFLNLLFIYIFANFLSFFGLITFFVPNLLICFWIIRTKLKSLNVLFYGRNHNESSDIIDKTIKLIIKYSWILVVIWMLLRLIFPELRDTRTDWLGFLGVISIWFGYNIGITAALMYLFLPHSLAGYYMYKYPEEYRLREGKTPEEWYGEKYLKKHGGM